MAELEDFEYTLTRKELRQIKAEVWDEAVLYLDAVMGSIARRAAIQDNPYRD